MNHSLSCRDHFDRLKLIKQMEEMEELRPERLYEDWILEGGRPKEIGPEDYDACL